MGTEVPRSGLGLRSTAAVLVGSALAASLFLLAPPAEAMVESVPAVASWYHATCMAVRRDTPEAACADGNNGVCNCCSNIGPGSNCAFAGLENYRPDWQGCNWSCPGIDGIITRGAAAGGFSCPAADPPYAYNGATGQCERTIPDCSPLQCAGKCSAAPFPISYPPFQYSWDRATLSCPSIFGGKAGFAVSATGQYDATDALCGSGCKATQAKKFKAEPSFTLCGKNGVSKGVVGTVEIGVLESTTYSKKCSHVAPQYACETVCDSAKKCEEETFSASITGGVQWNAGVAFGKTFAGGAVSVGIFCEGVSSLQAGGSLARKTTTNKGFDGVCDDCEDVTYGPKLTGKATGSCSINVGRTLPKGVAGSGVVADSTANGLTLDYAQEFLYTKKSGACGNAECLTSKVSAKASVDFSPTKCLSTFGRGVKLQVKGSVGGVCSGSSCSGAPDNGCSWNPDISTFVVKTCKP